MTDNINSYLNMLGLQLDMSSFHIRTDHRLRTEMYRYYVTSGSVRSEASFPESRKNRPQNFSETLCRANIKFCINDTINKSTKLFDFLNFNCTIFRS